MTQRGDWRYAPWWADLPEPKGSDPGYRRPVLVIQSNDFNRSRIATAIVVIITSNLKLTGAPGKEKSKHVGG